MICIKYSKDVKCCEAVKPNGKLIFISVSIFFDENRTQKNRSRRILTVFHYILWLQYRCRDIATWKSCHELRSKCFMYLLSGWWLWMLYKCWLRKFLTKNSQQTYSLTFSFFRSFFLSFFLSYLYSILCILVKAGKQTS